jgi:transglutaminase-like putative cysteine protease
MLIKRMAATIGAATLLALLAWHLSTNEAPAVQRAKGLLGERWYQLALSGEPMGYWFTSTFRDRDGRWVFESEQRSALNPENPITISTRRIFAAAAPFDLLEAHYLHQQRDSSERIAISRTASGYRGRMIHGDADHESPMVDLDWTYTLSDYLEFEIWLHDTQPAPGTLRAIRTLDFKRMDVLARQLKVVAHNAIGYRIENPAPQAATSIQLDADYVPQTILLAGLFDLTLTSREQALAPRTVLHSASYYIPLDKPLTDHTRIRTLDLAVNSDVPAADIWDQSRRSNGEWILSLQANPLTNPTGERFAGTTLSYPTDDHRISILAREAVAGLDGDAARVAALVRYVHGFLRYEPGAKAQPVLTLLDHPVGDCTEFADLFTTLARSIGIPSHTVFGLAYSDEEAPAFAFHAWNEVEVDGVWQAVDPTWNQLRVDATHIPLPPSEAAAMKLLTGNVKVTFELRNLEYFAD